LISRARSGAASSPRKGCRSPSRRSSNRPARRRHLGGYKQTAAKLTRRPLQERARLQGFAERSRRPWAVVRRSGSKRNRATDATPATRAFWSGRRRWRSRLWAAFEAWGYGLWRAPRARRRLYPFIARACLQCCPSVESKRPSRFCRRSRRVGTGLRSGPARRNGARSSLSRGLCAGRLLPIFGYWVVTCVCADPARGRRLSWRLTLSVTGRLIGHHLPGLRTRARPAAAARPLAVKPTWPHRTEHSPSSPAGARRVEGKGIQPRDAAARRPLLYAAVGGLGRLPLASFDPG
jgi:hypothetical protein